MANQTTQLELLLSTPAQWGGRRKGAGRKPRGGRPEIRHASRESFAGRHPAHITLRIRPDVPSLRTGKLVAAFERSLGQACERGDFRVVHYSLQSNHVHLLVEAIDRAALACGMKAVGARLARVVNRIFGRVGSVLAERYHLRVLQTPREVRNALRYVLLNAHRHASRLVGRAHLDPASSARWFDGWCADTAGAGAGVTRSVAPARTWLLTVGWKRHGLIDPSDVPGR